MENEARHWQLSLCRTFFRRHPHRCQTTMEMMTKFVWVLYECRMSPSREWDGTEGWTMTRRWGITLELLTLSSQRRRRISSGCWFKLWKPGYPADEEREEIDEQPLLDPPGSSSCYSRGLLSPRVHLVVVALHQHHVVLGRHLGDRPRRPLWSLVHLNLPSTAAFIFVVVVIVVIGIPPPDPSLVGPWPIGRSFSVAVFVITPVAVPTAHPVTRVVGRFWGEV